MTVAVDSSVLLSIINGEPDAPDWVLVLARARANDQLVICDVVYAECSPGLPSKEEFDNVLVRLGIQYDSIQADAAHLAGQHFATYRRQGGPRINMIPDFLIGAHAQIQADQLAATDRGYLRRYFPSLKLLQPVASGDAPKP